MQLTLDAHVRNDSRILDVYREARRRYAQVNLLHHNFAHVMRDLHRALVIATDEEAVDYGILIPSVLLHDIGFCSPDLKKLGHDVAGALLAAEILANLNYQNEAILAISHCIRAHKGKAELPQTPEAKILNDADVLEKAGIIFLIFGGKIICEFGETLDFFLERELVDRAKELKRGFYTRKARELDGGRLEKVLSLFGQIKKELTEDRPDYAVSEQDLWLQAVPADTSDR